MSPGAFRFFLASLVVASHYTSIGLGHAAVFLFFALSGYWVHHMWQEKYSATRFPYLTYIVSRVWRLAPVFLLCSCMALVIFTVLPVLVAPAIPFATLGADSVLSSFVLLGYNTLRTPPLVPAWSLDIELQFYFVAPLIIVALARRSAATVAAIGCLALIGCVLWGEKTLLAFLPFFLIGMLTARRPNLIRGRLLASRSAVATIAVIGVFIIVPALRPMLFGGAHPAALFKYNEFLNVAVALLAMPFALNTAFRKSDKRDRLLSDASYSLYLFHWIPFLIIGHYLPQIGHFGTVMRGVFTLPVLIATYAFAIGLTQWVDRPLNTLRARYVKRRSERVADARSYSGQLNVSGQQTRLDGLR